MFLGLDPSGANTGWAIWKPGMDLPISGSLKLCDGRHQYAGACIEMHRFLAAKHAEHRLLMIMRESAILIPSDTLAGLLLTIGLATHVESWAKVKNVPCKEVNSKGWRGTWLPDAAKGTKGENWKFLAVRRARQYGMDPTTHDEAEAIGILDHLMLKQKFQPPWRLALPLLPTL